ncbi:hypothetical protein MKW94_030903, partial [Papaver nudicaule]|nr:hypothetical protein [Papaver nudicaule]
PKFMKKPVYIYYELDNFYQNHRRYVESSSTQQLWRKEYENKTRSCRPINLTPNRTSIVPCGLKAWSLFNDTYTFFVNDGFLNVSKEGIAWKSDKGKFGKDVFPKNFQGGGMIGGAKLNASIP